MPLSIVVTGEAGMDLYATLQQFTAAGVAGLIWNNTSLAWESNPATNLREIALTQGTSTQAGSWAGGVTAALGTYTGVAILRIHDRNQSNLVVATSEVMVASGAEVLCASTADVAALPLATHTTIVSQGGVPSTNVSTMTTAVNNAKASADAALAEATLAKTEATAAKNAANAAQTSAADAFTQAFNASVASQAANNKLPSDTATKINRLDANITSRSSHAAADVRADINANGGVLSSNMRGTDNALLAASYVAPANATITTAASDAAQAKTDVTTLLGRLTSTRAGYLDNLSAGAVAQQSTLTGIVASFKARLIGPASVSVPSTGSSPVLLVLTLQNGNGAPNNADATPLVSARNAAGTDRSTNLGSVTNPATGRYEVTYTVASTHLDELITITAAWAEGGQASFDLHTMQVSSLAASTGSFTSTDRTQLQAIHAKLPSRAFLTGTAASTGDINLDLTTGDKTAFGPSNAGLATAASIASLPADIRAHINANGGVLSSNMRGTDNALLAANYTAPDNAGIASTLSQATTAATQATTAATQATNAASTALAINGKLPSDTSTRLTNLDVAVSTRSTFNAGLQSVLLTPGHGLATATVLADVKAKTDLIQAGSGSGTAPTTGEITAAVVSGLLAAQPGTWAGGGDATLANQTVILSQLNALTPTPVSPKDVTPNRTLYLRYGSGGMIAPNVVRMSSASSLTIAMDFSDALNPDASVTAVTEFVVVSGDGMSATNLVASGNRREAHFTLTTPTAGKRRVRVKVTTSDGETLVGFGEIDVF